MTHDPTQLPTGLPAPVDDGAAAHLVGAMVAEVTLASTLGGAVNLREACQKPTVVFFYPRTGVPGVAPPAAFDGTPWDLVPGMRGCTPQSCGFRDLSAEFAGRGVSILAVSTQEPWYQEEFAKRMHIMFAILSDAALELSRAMRLPTIEMPVEQGGPSTLLKRMAWFCRDGRVEKVWYPVFPPNENAKVVLAHLRETLRDGASRGG